MSSVSGGDRLAAALERIKQHLDAGKEVRVGFLEGATYPDGTSVPLVAAVQEFGAPAKNIPPRPFFRTMIAEKSPGWGNALGKLLKAHDYDASAALRLMGDGISGQLRQSVVDLTSPALAPATVAAKGSSKPLVDTGHMLNSIDYEVE